MKSAKKLKNQPNNTISAPEPLCQSQNMFGSIGFGSTPKHCLPVIVDNMIIHMIKLQYDNRVGHPFFSKERSDLCVLFRSL